MLNVFIMLYDSTAQLVWLLLLFLLTAIIMANLVSPWVLLLHLGQSPYYHPAISVKALKGT